MTAPHQTRNPLSLTACQIVLAAIVSLSAAACGETGGGGDADGRADGSGDGAVEGGDGGVGDGEAGADGDVEAEAGPLSFVVNEVEVVLDRLWDLDGDGQEDNAMADIGSAQGGLLAMAFGTAFQGLVTESSRLLLHFPWIDDLTRGSDPDLVFMVLEGADTDVPVDPSDDFSGEEPFYAHARLLDTCGEPRNVIPHASLDSGTLAGETDAIAVSAGFSPLVMRGAHTVGELGGGGESIEITVGAALLVRELGALYVGSLGPTSMLEMLVAGGQPFGLPSVSGLSPDLDLDGDGLERLFLGEDGRVESCLDGDATVIEGADCWADERMADGISFLLVLSGVGAELVEPSPSWAFELGGRCEEFPRTPEVWGPCPAEACERWESRPCTTSCGGDGLERCAFDCSGFEGCLGTATAVARATACDDVALAGGAICSGDPAAVTLADGAGQKRGARLLRSVEVGHGAVVFEARATTSLAGSEYPGDDWAIVVYRDAPPDPWLGPSTDGFDVASPGYVFRRAFNEGSPELEVDGVSFHGSPGGEAGSLVPLGSSKSATGLAPNVDAAMEGPVEQALRLVIVPDLPETDENEMAVVALPVVGASVITGNWLCRGLECPAQIQVGDTLHFGVNAGTSDAYARIELPLDALSVEVQGACP